MQTVQFKLETKCVATKATQSRQELVVLIYFPKQGDCAYATTRCLKKSQEYDNNDVS